MSYEEAALARDEKLTKRKHKIELARQRIAAELVYLRYCKFHRNLRWFFYAVMFIIGMVIVLKWK